MKRSGESHDSQPWQKRLDNTTRSLPETPSEVERIEVPTLTLLAHPDVGRVGEEARLLGLLSEKSEEISRLSPWFAPPTGGAGRPLADVHLSRRPLRLVPTAHGLVLDATALTGTVLVDGQRIDGKLEIRREALTGGVVLLLAQRIALLLHSSRLPNRRPATFGMVGESSTLLEVRREIERLADLSFPVLVRGESGSGKELVARALHDSSRRHGPFVSVNMGAIPPALAAAELFGAAKGAFTGADRQRQGCFQRAHGGTLFLDEIGEASSDIQVLLLRALEDGEVQPVGAVKPQAIDVRLIAATDMDLETAIEGDRFRAPLYHRLATCEIRLPPLRLRRADIGRLVLHFLRQELEKVEEGWRLAPEDNASPWLPAELVVRLALHPWPGNVRQLRNVVRQIVVGNRGEPTLRLPRPVEDLLAARPPDAPTERRHVASGPPTRGFRDAEEVSDSELLEALKSQRWSRSRAADVLGVSRPALYRLIKKNPRIRQASDLQRDEILAAQQRCQGRLEAMVDVLEVSKRALKLRITKLGLED